MRRRLATRKRDSWYVLIDLPFISLFDPYQLQEIDHTSSDNIFDALPTVSTAEKTAFLDELTRFLASPPESTRDPLRWWMERRAIYPCLSRMALDYLSVPGMSLFHPYKFNLLIT
jgi:hypothetical protein